MVNASANSPSFFFAFPGRPLFISACWRMSDSLVPYFKDKFCMGQRDSAHVITILIIGQLMRFYHLLLHICNMNSYGKC